MEQRLKEAVERIVRPIPAGETGKDRLREELWSHLQELFKQEKALGADGEAALESAVTRLGPADTIRGTYLQSLNRVERMLGWVEYVTEHDPSRSRFGTALRFSGVVLLGTTTVSLCVILVGPWLLEDMGKYLFNLAAFGVTLNGWVAAWSFGAVMFLKPYQHALRAAGSRRGRLFVWLRYQVHWATLFSVISIFVWCLSVATVAALVGGNDVRFIEFAYMSGMLLAGFSTFQIPLLPYLVLRSESARRHIPDWPYDETVGV